MNPKIKSIIKTVLVVIIIILAVILVVGSLFALFRPSSSEPLFNIGRQENIGETRIGVPDDGEISIFTGIGRLRIPAAGSPPATIILSISFPYPAADRLFAEELASHIGDFRSIATNYFSSLNAERIISLNEDAAKTEILNRYNALLRLGKIQTLYFSDLMVIN